MTTLPATPSAEQRPYTPYGAARQLAVARDKEVLIAGPSGTGKSRACLEKVYRCALEYPGMRALILRKTRESLSESGLYTLETQVIPAGDPVLAGPQRNLRQAYRLTNGSELVVGGLDKPSKVMSTEYDLVYVQEATEANEEDWELAGTRLRHGRMAYAQLLGDANPDAPTHWLKQRCNRGQTRLLESRHEDNPAVTPAYLERLDQLTGVRYQRLRQGLWVAAEGLVFNEWQPAFHRLDRFEIPREWARFWSVDFGFTNPFVWQAWAQDHDGRLFRYREIYHTQRLVEDHARQILAVTAGEPRPRAVVCDHDAEDRATLERYLGFETTPAFKSVSPGLQAVATRLRAAKDDVARLFFLRDSLVERDPHLADAKKPTCTEEEFDSYVWDTSAGRRRGEEPLKKDDHGIDSARYLVAHVDGLAGGPDLTAWAGLLGGRAVRGWSPR